MGTDGTHRGQLCAWLRKKKSGTSAFRMREYNKRYFTLDFDTHTFFYTHSEGSKKVSSVTPFADIVDVRLPEADKLADKGDNISEVSKTSKRSSFFRRPSGFLTASKETEEGRVEHLLMVMTRPAKTFELLCSSATEAVTWFEALKQAIALDRGTDVEHTTAATSEEEKPKGGGSHAEFVRSCHDAGTPMPFAASRIKTSGKKSKKGKLVRTPVNGTSGPSSSAAAAAAAAVVKVKRKKAKPQKPETEDLGRPKCQPSRALRKFKGKPAPSPFSSLPPPVEPLAPSFAPSLEGEALASARTLVAELAIRGQEACEVRLRSVANPMSATPRPELGPALAHCAERGLEACVQLLLQKRAMADSCGLRNLANQAVLGKRTALQLAAENGHTPVCRLLLQAGSNGFGLAGAIQKLKSYGQLFDREVRELEGMNDEEDAHYKEVCYSLLSYAEDAASELMTIAETFHIPDPRDQAMMKLKVDDLMNEMKQCIVVNDHFLKMLVLSDLDAQDYWQMPPDHQVQERNSMKARTVLRQFVRDWGDEGAQERDVQYGCLLDALERYVPKNARPSGGKPRVLAPGSGLSRLPFECARRGYAAQGNEFSYHMLQGCKWVLNETDREKSHVIYPFVLNLENRRNALDHVRPVAIPDDFSMCAGEFINVYEDQIAEWDAVLTCFFLDTAKNVFLYIRTIADIIRPGGLWANFGPLLYHYAEQPDQISIELSWEEDFREALYTTNPKGMYRTRYLCIYFAAIRNDVETEGESFPSTGAPGAPMPEAATLVEEAGPVVLQAADFGFAEDEDGSMSSASDDEPKGSFGYATGAASIPAPAAPAERLDTMEFSDAEEDDDDPLGLKGK
eukprot:g31916.t2